MAQSGLPPNPAVLFTAFEPSGDAHAAPIIRELRFSAPQLRIFAWGGREMESAGATLVEHTTGDAAMGVVGPGKIASVRKQIKAIKTWTKENRILGHVAVDSPAANFPICKFMRKTDHRVIHVVAPQMWAWGKWRVTKLRKNTNGVLCLLPFEEQWFNDRNVPARFIGHPAINRSLDAAVLEEEKHGLPQGSPRIVLFPGSRQQEVKANIKLLVNAFIELHDRQSGCTGLIVAASKEMAQIIRKKIGMFPANLHMVTGRVDAAISWCDIALAVSGTVTLHIARHQKPMVGVYKTGLGAWMLSKLLLRTKVRLLPNVIAEREIVPEFVPHVGGCMPLVKEATHILSDSKHGAIQAAELKRVCQRFTNKRPAKEGAQHILRVLTTGQFG